MSSDDEKFLILLLERQTLALEQIAEVLEKIRYEV